MTTDVYKDEFLQQLKQSHIYKALVNKCGEKDSEVIALVRLYLMQFRRQKLLSGIWESLRFMIVTIYSGCCI